MEELTRNLTLAEIDQRITRSAVEAVIEIGYYLKQIRDRKLYLEAGCKDVYEYAEKQYGYSQSTTSRNMNRNDKFSVGGNSPELAGEYRQYSKSQLQEMLSLEDRQLKEVRPEMTVKQIREMKKPELDVKLANQYLMKFWNHWMNDKVRKEAVENPNQMADLFKKEYGACHRGAGSGDFDFQCSPKGIRFSGKGLVELTWAKAAKLLRDLISAGTIGYTEPEKKEEPVATSHKSGRCIHRPEFFCSEEDEHKLILGDGMNCNEKCCWDCTKHGDCSLECASSANRQEPPPEPLSALGFQKTIRLEGSSITTPGCGKGKYDCFSCHRECDIRQEECYCVHAPLGNPYPCTIVQNGLEQLEFAADGCQFLNLDLADHRAGDGEPVPCCEKCDCKDSCSTVCDRVKKSIATSHKEAVAETQQKEVECCEDAAEAETYTPRYFLEEQKARLDEILALGEDEVKFLPRKMVARRKIIVEALAAMVCDLEGVEETEKPEQPELPTFKNNDQRKEWLRNYRDWGLCYADDNIGARYFRYEFGNGAVLVAEEYEHSNGYAEHHVSSFLHLVGGPKPTKGSGGYGKWRWNEKYNRYPNSETELVEFLKEMQKETEIDKLINEMKSHICDELCRHPRYAESQEELDQICAECRMGSYVCGILNTYNELNDFEKAQCAALMEKYSRIVLCDECEYHAVEKPTGIHHCRLGGGLIGALKSGDGCSRGKLRGVSIDRE